MSRSHRRFVADFSQYVSSPTRSAHVLAPRRSGLTSLLKWIAGLQGVEATAVRVLVSEEGQCGDGSTVEYLCQSLDLPTVVSSEAGLKLVCEQIESDSHRDLSTLWLLDRPNPSLLRFAKELAEISSGLRLLSAGPNVIADDCRNHLGNHQDDHRDSENPLTDASSKLIQLGSLAIAEVAEMLDTCLGEVGGDRRIFSETAVHLLHKLSGGRMGFIAGLAEESLRIAAQWMSREVTAEHVLFVFSDPLQQAA
jgi:hypothetical protein